MCKLSVIIPHYNAVNSLRKLLFSIPIIKDIEIIVIDDNSNEQLEEYEKLCMDKDFEHDLFLKNQTSNKGAGACRNIGLIYAKGQWILFADSDDYFIEGFFEKLKPYFKTDNDVVFFVSTSIEIDTQQIATRHTRYK